MKKQIDVTGVTVRRRHDLEFEGMSAQRRPAGPVYVFRLRVPPQADAVRSLNAALKVLGRRFGLRATSIQAEQESGQAQRRVSAHILETDGPNPHSIRPLAPTGNW